VSGSGEAYSGDHRVNPRARRSATARVRRAVDRYGVLPFSAPEGALSAIRVITGVTVRGSWWGHPAGHLIYWVAEGWDRATSVIATAKLLGGKVTLVHSRLWPALVSVGKARASWQTGGLDPGARNLLRTVDRLGYVRGDLLSQELGMDYASFRHGVKRLELRLLVSASSVHTRTGAHALAAESWSRWASRRHLARWPSPGQARRRFETAGVELGIEPESAQWPWNVERGGGP